MGSEAKDRNRRLRVWFTSLSGLGVLAGLTLHVWLEGGNAMRLIGGHNGQGLPLSEMAAYAAATAFGVDFILSKVGLAAR